MEQNTYDVFISYSRQDYVDEHKNVIPGNEISKIRVALDNAGIQYWIDEEGVVPGEDYAQKIVKYIRASRIFLFISSKAANQSEWTKKEISCALMYKKYLIPLLLDDSPFHDSVMLRIVDLDRIDYWINPKLGLEKLVSSIRAYLDKVREQEEREREEERRRKEELERKRREEEAAKERQERIEELKDELKKWKEQKKNKKTQLVQLQMELDDCEEQIRDLKDKIDQLRETKTKKKIKASALERDNIQEYEWHQIIQECKNNPIKVVFESDFVADSIDLDKLFDALCKLHVSDETIEEALMCKTIVELKKMLVE